MMNFQIPLPSPAHAVQAAGFWLEGWHKREWETRCFLTAKKSRRKRMAESSPSSSKRGPRELKHWLGW
jgi:hypothetical protein